MFDPIMIRIYSIGRFSR